MARAARCRRPAFATLPWNWMWMRCHQKLHHNVPHAHVRSALWPNSSNQNPIAGPNDAHEGRCEPNPGDMQRHRRCANPTPHLGRAHSNGERIERGGRSRRSARRAPIEEKQARWQEWGAAMPASSCEWNRNCELKNRTPPRVILRMASPHFSTENAVPCFFLAGCSRPFVSPHSPSCLM